MNQDPNAAQNQQQPKEKKVLTLDEQEKANKKIAFIIMVSLCSLFVVMGLVGGVVKFIRFVDDMNPQPETNPTDTENQFYKDGKLLFRNGGQVIAEYKCEHPSCGWAFATTDDAQFETRTPNDGGGYELKGIVNDRYAIIYDDESSDSPSNIIIYDIQENAKKMELSGIKNYNMDTGNMYIAKNKEGKWGIISLAGSSIEQIIEFQFEYIGVVLQDGETIREQKLFVALKSNNWSIISTTKASGSISGNFTEQIIAYNHKYVITKSDTPGLFYNIYTLHGQEQAIEKDVKDIILPGYNILISYTTDTADKKVVIYDAGNAKELEIKKLNTLQGVTAEVKDNKLIVKADNDVIYETNAQAINISIDDDKYIQEVSAPTGSDYSNSGDNSDGGDSGNEEE